MWGGCYDQLCCPASPELLLGIDLGLGCGNNTLDHFRQLVTDASLNFSETNPDVRIPVLNHPTSLAGQNAGHQIDQWCKTLYIGPVSDGRHASVSSMCQFRCVPS